MLTKIACNYNHGLLFGGTEILHSETYGEPTRQDIDKALKYISAHEQVALFFDFDNGPTICLYSNFGAGANERKTIEFQLIHSENSRDEIECIELREAKKRVRAAIKRQ